MWQSTAGTANLPLGIFISVTPSGKFPIDTVGKRQEQHVGTPHSEEASPASANMIYYCSNPFLPLRGWSNTHGAAPDGRLLSSSCLHILAFGMGCQPAGTAMKRLPALNRCYFLLQVNKMTWKNQLRRICCALVGTRVVSELWKCTAYGWNQAVYSWG